ncbi:MAG: GAF domain-containing protein [Anaerolineae bacterium]|nr:GAF domain-containing protein [Anaerolineae bacterium]
MSIRLRLVVILVFISVVPTLVAVFLATRQMEILMTSGTEDTIKKLAAANIRDKAESVARQVQIYLEHPLKEGLQDITLLHDDPKMIAVSVQPVGKTGYTAVFDAQGVTHFHANAQLVGKNMDMFAESRPEFWALFFRSLDGTRVEGFYDWTEADGRVESKFMAIAPVEGTNLRVAATTYIAEFNQPAEEMISAFEQESGRVRRNFIGLGVMVGFIAAAIAVGMVLWISAPVGEMMRAARRAVEGDWGAIAPSSRSDELGVLNQALYDMTSRVRTLVQGLEGQVQARTESLERHSRYLEATAQVAHEVSAVLDLDQLLPRVTQLIGERFGFYHAGLFLLDEAREWAVLRAASSEGGQRMLARNHRLLVGKQGIVGYAASAGELRVVLDVRQDTTFVYNPDLPDTQSEASVPMRARGQIIGVLDVQSVDPNAFIEVDVAVLQTMADLVAVAIDNAQLFARVEASVDAERRAFAQLTREAWRDLIVSQSAIGFVRDKRGLVEAGDVWRPHMGTVLQTGELAHVGAEIGIPLKVRDQVIGVIDARKPDGTTWTEQEIELMTILVQELTDALDNARLYEGTQRQAAREQAVGQISAEFARAFDLDTLLRAAVRELGRLPDVTEVSVHVDVPKV